MHTRVRSSLGFLRRKHKRHHPMNLLLREKCLLFELINAIFGRWNGGGGGGIECYVRIHSCQGRRQVFETGGAKVSACKAHSKF